MRIKPWQQKRVFSIFDRNCGADCRTIDGTNSESALYCYGAEAYHFVLVLLERGPSLLSLSNPEGYLVNGGNFSGVVLNLWAASIVIRKSFWPSSVSTRYAKMIEPNSSSQNVLDSFISFMSRILPCDIDGCLPPCGPQCQIFLAENPD